MQLRQRNQHCGETGFKLDDGAEVFGHSYRLETSGCRSQQDIYVFDGKSSVWYSTAWSSPKCFRHQKVSDPDLIAKLDAIRCEDLAIIEEWRTCAREHANADPLLEQVLFSSIGYNNGCLIEPEIRDDVAFYLVHMNATVSFYIGCKDGKKYVFDTWDSWDKATGDFVPRESIRCLSEGEDWICMWRLY